jgi:SUMO ligase MMS21 Smc5/6 complex component
VKEAQREQLEHHWTSCPLSHKPLTRPIVSDSAGNLYNKDAILKFLIPSEEVEGISSKADCEEILQGRVKGLRDVVELKLEVDTEHTATGTAGNNNNNNNINNNNNGNGKMSERWICPITTKQLGPSVKSVYLVPCGHVFSEEAIREMKGDKCLQVRADSPPISIVFVCSIKPVLLIIWNSVTKNIRMTTLSRSSPPRKPTTSVY